MVIHMQQKKENDNIMNYDTVRLDDENNAIIIIDHFCLIVEKIFV